ncbi:MAG: T9SS type A sorting domain-containing protein [Melioribacteraceae bacterium]|nr:T9SS type A sorting domain-containing protein [Melioribacteraceae bacterium]
MKVKLIMILTFLSINLLAQTVYEIPFNTKGNKIELTVENTSSINANDIKVKVLEKPDWLSIDSMTKELANLDAGETTVTNLEFSVDKEAPIGEESLITISLQTKNEQTFTKEINLKVLAPENFTLEQNYPNPFNPTTKIGFQLPQNARITLRIYDILGSEVVTLVDQNKTAGFHELNWNAGNLASGTYIYNLIAKMENGKTKTAKKKMLLLK